MGTPSKLSNDDFCHRLEFLSRSWERESLSPMQLLSRGIEAGLTSDAKDPGQVAGDRVMTLAVSRPIETPQTDLLGLAEHTSALGDFVSWMLRDGPPWKHPEVTDVGGHPWYPESYLGPRGLRRLVLCDRWDESRQIAESFDWRTLEGVIYDMPMTLIVVVLGASRDGRRHGPLSKGWLHPVSGDLRFRKRDSTDFGANWPVTFRENFRGEREEWLESMVEDGVLDETVLVHPVGDVAQSSEILELARNQMEGFSTEVLPPPQLAQCFDPIRQCPYRSCCPYFRAPSEVGGFINIRAASSLAGESLPRSR